MKKQTFTFNSIGSVALLAIMIMLIAGSANTANGQCLTNSLIINSGYNPLTASAITPGAQSGSCNCGTAVSDPHWFVTSVSSAIQTEATAQGQTAVSAGGNADVITNYGSPWVSYSTSQWISCLNSNQPWTLAGSWTSPNPNLYNTTLSRQFHMAASGSVISISK